MSTYLGLDYGLSHIGIALAESNLATPMPSMRNDENLLDNLNKFIKTHGVSHIVCGLPEGKLVPIIQKFGQSLTELAGIPVLLYPETLSTQEAKQKLKEAGASRAKRRNDHAYAACLILEDYLEFGST